MLRLLGACCIIAGCGILGFSKGEQFRQRAEMLRCLQNGLNMLEADISYGSTPLPLALARVAEKVGGITQVPFAQAARLLKENNGLTAAEAWEEGVNKLDAEFTLTTEEKSILILFGQGLGCSAREEQIKNITLAREQLRMAELAAEEARNKNQRMWQVMGLCTGGAIVLMLI